MPLIDLANPSQLDEQIFNTWVSWFGQPAFVLNARGDYAATPVAVDGGPGAFVNDAELERGYNAWYGAPGYYVDARTGVDRVIPDQYVADMYPPAIGVNPWDHIFGPIGGDPVHYMQRVAAREQPIQAGEYSLS